MKRIRNFALLVAVVAGFTKPLLAQSTLSGTFVYPLAPDLTAICGSIHFTITDGQVSFQSTLFQAWTSGDSLEPVLVVQGIATPFNFGTGTPGSWELGEFFGFMPGITPVPPDGQGCSRCERAQVR